MCLIKRGVITELSCSAKCFAQFFLCLKALLDNYPVNETKERSGRSNQWR